MSYKVCELFPSEQREEIKTISRYHVTSKVLWKFEAQINEFLRAIYKVHEQIPRSTQSLVDGVLTPAEQLQLAIQATSCRAAWVIAAISRWLALGSG